MKQLHDMHNRIANKMGGRITKIQSLSKDQMRMMMKLNSIKAGSVKKKKKAKEEQTFIVDEARLEA